MTDLEKNLLASIKASLYSSTLVTWSMGDIDQWKARALREKHAIDSACATLDVLIKQTSENPLPVNKVMDRPQVNRELLQQEVSQKPTPTSAPTSAPQPQNPGFDFG